MGPLLAHPSFPAALSNRLPGHCASSSDHSIALRRSHGFRVSNNIKSVASNIAHTGSKAPRWKMEAMPVMDVVAVTQDADDKQLDKLSLLVRKIASGADVFSSLEPWIDTLAVDDWNKIVADVGRKNWTLAMQVVSVLKENGRIWDEGQGRMHVDATKDMANGTFEARQLPSMKLKIYTTLVAVLSRQGRNEEVLRIFEEMKLAGIEPDVFFYNALLGMYAKEGMVTDFSKVLLDMERTGVKPDHLTYEKLIAAYLNGDNPQPDKAKQVLNEMRKANLPVGIVTYKDLIQSFWQNDCIEGAEEIFASLQLAGYSPDIKMVLKLMQLNGRKGNYKRNEELFQMLRTLKIQPNCSVYDYLVHAYCKSGLVDRACSILLKYKQTLKPSLVAYNMMIDGCGKSGFHDKVVELYADLCNSGLKPSVVTYTSVITAMVKVGKYEKAEEIYRKLLRLKVSPNVHVYTAMIHCYTERNWTKTGHEMYTAMRCSQHKLSLIAYGAILALYLKGGWYTNAASVFKEMEDEGLELDVASHGVVIRACGEKEGTFASFERVIKESKTDFCKMLKSLFFSGQRWDAEMKQLAVDRVSAFLERWKDSSDPVAIISISNALLDSLWTRGLKGTARVVLSVARGLFSGYAHPKFCDSEWILDLRGLSIGAAKVAVADWLGDAALLTGESLIASSTFVVIMCGNKSMPTWIQNSQIGSFEKRLRKAVVKMLEERGSPFMEPSKNVGRLQASASHVVRWVSMHGVKESLSLVDC